MRHNINITLYSKNHIICALYGWVNNLLYIRYYLNLQLNVVAKCITHHSVTYTTSEICSSWHALYRWQTVDNEQKKHNCRIYLQLQSSNAISWVALPPNESKMFGVGAGGWSVWRTLELSWSSTARQNSKITTAQILNTYFGIFCCLARSCGRVRCWGRCRTHSRIFYYN